jgi:hypothetical protein
LFLLFHIIFSSSNMTTATASIPFSCSDPSDEESAEELLEKMLKQAQELADKMSRKASSIGSGSTSTAAGSDLSDPTGIDDMSRIKIDDLSSDNDTELEELLKRSETLLGKMRSQTFAIAPAPEASTSTPPAIHKVEPPKISPNAPTSVYLLETIGTPDDVSSVGSNSLRSAVVSPFLRMPTYSSSTDPIQEETSVPSVKPLPVPSIRDDSAEQSDPGMVNGEKIAFITQIPDFTITSPDAKWEKVDSAVEGDDDYVPLVDYSKASPNTEVTAVSSDTGVDHPLMYDDAYYAGVESVITTTTTRVAAFRAQKRRLQMKRQRRVTFLILGITLVGGYRMYLRQQPATSYQKEEVESNVLTRDDSAVVDHSSYPENETIEEAQQPLLSEVELDEIMDIIRRSETFCDIDDEKFSEEIESNTETDEESILDDTVDAPNIPEVRVSSEEETNQIDSSVLVVESRNNPLQQFFNRIRRRLQCQTDMCLEKRCKNIFQRIFNRRCRIRARQKQEMKDVHSVNHPLQAEI